MAEIGYTLAAKLLEVLGCEAIRKVCELWGYQSELAELQQTVSTVRMVLLDADAHWDQLSNQDRDFVSRLKDVVYDADDVFDEFRTLAELKQLGRLKKGGKVFAKVRRFFSSKNQVGEAYRMSCEVKDIKKRLDEIAGNHKKFELKIDYKPIVRRPDETCSYVDVKDIIGREKDKKAIMDMLFDGNGDEGVRFLSIVGVGGLGKTALAQLVFNDEKIKHEFSERLWVCVSDQDGEIFDAKAILCKIMGQGFDGTTSTFQSVQTEFQARFKGKKYFLVIDDVWNEDRVKWLQLKTFLALGDQASRILVTSRSKSTATIVGDGDDRTYMLQGLSEEDSWHLFELSAFTSKNKDDKYDEELVNLGKRIVEMCYCVPLAIKVVGSLLYGQDIAKWRSFEGRKLEKIEEGDNNKILPILKLSYHNLKPSLKSCFSYCALFPKDFRIEKEKVVGMWMAQGYAVSWDDARQSVEEVAEEHFSILLRRCFFQDVERDEYGDVLSVKIHDLMHDVALDVGKEEICIVTSITNNLGDKVRHVATQFGVGGGLINSLDNKKIRSFISLDEYFTNTHIDSWKRLRCLKLTRCNVEILLDSIGKLLHLRYLDLSGSSTPQVLSDSITELHNLQTLNLSECWKLRELPNGMSKLVNLRCLDLEVCEKLTCMPSGMDKLTNLTVLSSFMVGYKSIKNEKCSGDGTLKDLRALTKIQGKLSIEIGDHYRDVDGNEGGYLKSMNYLRVLEIMFKNGDNEEAILEKLEPPPNLKQLELHGYKGKRIERWGRAEDNWAISLPFLVHIEIFGCRYLEEITPFSKLPHLKSLQLLYLDSLEYMENGMTNTQPFFPSLEYLVIDGLPKLNGWWKEEISELSLIFPRLSCLDIQACPNLVSNLICPSLEKLRLENNSERLEISYGNMENDVVKLTTLMVKQRRLKLQPLKEKENKMELKKLEELNILGSGKEVDEELSKCEDEDVCISLSQSLRHLELGFLPKLESLPTGMQCLTSLQTLMIKNCPGIKSLPEAIQDLTSLNRLTIEGCPDLQLRCQENIHKLQHIPYMKIGNKFYTHGC